MKTLKEITPDSETRYEMPHEVYVLVQAALGLGIAKTVKGAVASLPDELRRQVEVTAVCKALPADPLRGYRADVLIVDDFELRDWKQEYECQFVQSESKQRVDSLGRVKPK